MKTHKSINYYLTYTEAQEVKDNLPTKWMKSSRIVKYELGFAVQLHKSGPYVGFKCDPNSHVCRWCEK